MLAEERLGEQVPTGVTSAIICKECHATIFSEWQESWMARAFTQERFQRDYVQMRKYDRRTSSSESARCLTCHAPAALLVEDIEVAAPVSREGVTCDVCHRVKRVKPGKARFRPEYAPAGPRFGMRDVPVEGHPVRASAAFADSTLCASCHFEQIAPGIHIERTFDEWAGSSYAASGVSCADCHMPRRAGPATRTAGFESDSDLHASHRFEGGHAGSTLLAGAAQIVEIARAGDRFVSVRVRNVRAGHSIPTAGAHPNELIAYVEFRDASGGTVARAEQAFRFEYLDATGRPADPSVPVRSVRDTTLGAGAEKALRFSIPTVEGSREGDPSVVEVVARLVYRLLPPEELRALSDSEESDAYAPTTIDEKRLTLE